MVLNDTVIDVKHVWKIFGGNGADIINEIERDGLTKTDVLEKYNAVVGIADVSFSVKRAEIFCIMGLSGSGKSTLVRHINRLIEPTSGQISLLGQDVLRLGSDKLRELRSRQVGMVFQHMALLPHRSVQDNVAYPLEVRGEPKKRRWEVSQEKLSLVGLAGYENRFPAELSGGMQQRVGLARALASDPDVLLMDEPFSALDPLIRRQLQDEFKALSAKLGKTTVFITHDLDEAIRLGSRIAIMKDGRIVQVGTPEEIVMQPVDDYVRDFVSDISNLRFVHADSIMKPLAEYHGTEDLSAAPRARHDTDLNGLVDISVETDLPVVISDADGNDIGVVSKARLLRGIQGGE